MAENSRNNSKSPRISLTDSGVSIRTSQTVWIRADVDGHDCVRLYVRNKQDHYETYRLDVSGCEHLAAVLSRCADELRGRLDDEQTRPAAVGETSAVNTDSVEEPKYLCDLTDTVREITAATNVLAAATERLNRAIED